MPPRGDLVLGFVSEPIGLVVILQRALHVAFVTTHNCPVVEGVGIVRLQPDGLAVILQRTLHVTFFATHIAPLDEGFVIVRLEPDGFLVIPQRALHVAFVVARNAPVDVGIRKVRIEPDGLVVILQRTLSTRKTKNLRKADSEEAVQCDAKTKTARELTSQGVSRMASRPPEDAVLITVGFSVGVVSINRLHFFLWSFGRAGD
jgi:hypothetical protein